jgi:hypothetical protein
VCGGIGVWGNEDEPPPMVPDPPPMVPIGWRVETRKIPPQLRQPNVSYISGYIFILLYSALRQRRSLRNSDSQTSPTYIHYGASHTNILRCLSLSRSRARTLSLRKRRNPPIFWFPAPLCPPPPPHHRASQSRGLLPRDGLNDSSCSKNKKRQPATVSMRAAACCLH